MQKEDFTRGWQFHLGEPHHETWNWPQDASWRPLDLPHDWSIELPRSAEQESGKHGGFFETGRGWYRKYFTPPAEWEGQKVWLEFEGVYMNAEITLNEHYLLRHPYGYTSFLVDLTPWLRLGEENLLRVRVDNTHQLNSRWYSGSGIYRPVWLLTAPPLHFRHWGIQVTTPVVSAAEASIHVNWKVENEKKTPAAVELCGMIYDGENNLTAELGAALEVEGSAQGEISAQVSIADPKRWSPDTPALYRLVSELRRNGELVDRAETVFGIRSLEFSASQGFLLNGEPLKLKGGCVHHDNGILGAASYARSEERKVELHKASGYNAIRTAHNPPAPAFLEACDRLGMLVMDEAFDCWREPKNIGDYHVVFDDWWERDIEAMVLRDFNHPCIFAWSIGNEVLERDRPEGARIAEMLAQKVRALDPSRPVTSAICDSWAGKPWENTDATYAKLDVGGYNYLWQKYESDHSRFPQRLMIGTESFPIEAWENWQQVLAHPYVLGDFVWTSLDYLGESGIGRTWFADETFEFLGEYPWHHANCGDLDLTGFKRPQSWYRDILWKEDAPQTIVVHEPLPAGRERKISRWGWPLVWSHWNWAKAGNEALQVDVYTPHEEVELFLNGRSLGKAQAEKHIASFQVPWQAGELRAVGRSAGGAQAETILHSNAPAAALRLSADRATIPPRGLVYLSAEVLDKNGALHPSADRALRFTLTGAGRILAVGSADPCSTEAYVGTERTSFHGRVLVVVQAGENGGELLLKAEAEGLQPADIRIAIA